MTRATAAAVLVLAMALGAANVAAAQEPVTSFDLLNTRLMVGDTIWVTDAQGREVKGKIRDLSPASLLVDVGGTPQDFQATRVGMIRTQRKDPLWNGALWGALAGAVTGAASCLLNPECGGGRGRRGRESGARRRGRSRRHSDRGGRGCGGQGPEAPRVCRPGSTRGLPPLGRADGHAAHEGRGRLVQFLTGRRPPTAARDFSKSSGPAHDFSAACPYIEDVT